MKRPNQRWSLRARLTALAVGASCITAAIGAVAIWSNGRVADVMGFVQEQRVKPLVQLDIVGRRLERQRASVLATLAATDDVMQQALEKQLAKDATEIPAALRPLRDREPDIRQKALLDNLLSAVAKSRDDGLAAVVDKLRKGQFVEADAASQSRYRPQMEAATRLVDEVLLAQVELADRDYREALGVTRWQKGLTLAMVLLALCAGLALAAIMGRAVQRALGAHEQELAQGARRVASGRLGERIATADGDRESVAASLNAMSEEFSMLLREVAAITDTVAATAERLAEDSRDLSLRSAGQAASLEQTAASTQQLSTTVAQNAQRAEEAQRLARSASDLAVAGGKAMAEAQATMTDIADSSRRVTQIASVIDGIAFQTNILALNAAVEAARAGEAGRGFAVVAAEVRSLSQRSAAAAREIRELIEESAKRSQLGLNGVGQAAGTMRAIVDASRGVTSTVSEIAAATREQSSGIRQVNAAIEQLESVTQSNAALAERAARDVQVMSSQAASLVAAVSRFSPDDAGREAVEITSRAALAQTQDSLPPFVASPSLPAMAATAGAAIRLRIR